MSGITPAVAYLIGVPAIMLGSILFVGAIIGLITGRDEESHTGKAPRKKALRMGYAGFPPPVALTRCSRAGAMFRLHRHGPRRLVLGPSHARQFSSYAAFTPSSSALSSSSVSQYSIPAIWWFWRQCGQ